MAPVDRARWSTKPVEIVATANADGSFHGEVPLYDGATKLLTIHVDVTAGRDVRLFVHGEPGAVLGGFQAWSDL